MITQASSYVIPTCIHIREGTLTRILQALHVRTGTYRFLLDVKLMDRFRMQVCATKKLTTSYGSTGYMY